MMNQRSQGAFYCYCFKTFKTQNFTIKLSNHLLKVNQIKQLPVGTILSFYYLGKTVHLRFCSSLLVTSGRLFRHPRSKSAPAKIS